MDSSTRLSNQPTRRDFLKAGAAAAAAVALPTIVPSSVFGAKAPSNRINMGCIGLGGMGTANMRAFLNNPEVQVLAVCDPVRASNEYGHWYRHGWNGPWLGRESGRQIVNDHYSKQTRSGTYKDCASFIDFREIVSRSDIDAVTVVTPDHWHAVISIAAANTGKHIYCEKPLTLTIDEGKAMVQAVRRNGVILQTGSHERSKPRTRLMCELVRNGYIGQLKQIEVRVGPNHRKAPEGASQPSPVPDWLDYNMWLGPAPWAAYHKDRCLYKFRFITDYSGGNLTNFGAHSIDMGQWGNGTDYTGPVEVEDLGSEFPKDGLFDVATKVHFRARYANGVEMICKTGHPTTFVRFHGTEGWIANNGRCQPGDLYRRNIGPHELRLYHSNDHHRNFIDCIKTGKDPAAPVEIGHRSATICHVGNIAMRLKKKLQWDPHKEEFVNDDEANRMLSKPMRAPWRL